MKLHGRQEPERNLKPLILPFIRNCQHQTFNQLWHTLVFGLMSSIRPSDVQVAKNLSGSLDILQNVGGGGGASAGPHFHSAAISAVQTAEGAAHAIPPATALARAVAIQAIQSTSLDCKSIASAISLVLNKACVVRHEFHAGFDERLSVFSPITDQFIY